MTTRQSTGRRRLLDNLNTAVITLDSKLRIKALNAAAEMLLENSEKRLTGQSIDIIGPNNTALKTTLVQCLASEHLITAHEESLSLADGKTVTVDYTITPVTDDHSETALLLEMVQVDRLLRLAREQAMLHRQEANRSVIKGLAHEIKNPLGGIRGAAQLLERELSDPAQKEYTQIIIQEADRLRNLVDRMFGPNQPLTLVDVNVHEMLERLRLLLLAEIQQGIEITTNYDPSLPEIKADSDQLMQVLLNIGRNAIQAMNAHGTIQLRTRIERQFTVGQRRHRHVVRIDIEDNGPGIPPELAENIFYPLVTGRAEGTGLGLSIAQDIITLHGGLIECISQPHQTIFSLYLPLEARYDRE